MTLSYHETIKRTYSNNVTIIYEIIDNDNIYIHSIESFIKQLGNGTNALNSFIVKFDKFNIYVFSSSELGTDKEILDRWYEKLNFKRINNLDNIPYNITHVKYRVEE